MRGQEWPSAQEMCRVLRADNHAVFSRLRRAYPWQFANVAVNEYPSEFLRGWRMPIVDGNINWRLLRELTWEEENKIIGANLGTMTSSVMEYGQDVIDAVCVDRLTTSSEVGMRNFTEALPGWPAMDSARRNYYRRVFNRLIGRAGGERADRSTPPNAELDGIVEAGLMDGSPAEDDPEDTRSGGPAFDAAGRCSDEDSGTLWSLMDEIVDDEHERDRQAAEESFQNEFVEEYGLQTYVGSRLENEVYLKQIYGIEFEAYELNPERLESQDLPAPLRAYIRELTQEYTQILETEKDRARDMAKAELEAETQMERAIIQAKEELGKARLQAKRERDVELIRQQTELLKIRAQAAQKPGFFGQLAGAVAPALGGGLVKGVMDNWLFPPQPTTTEKTTISLGPVTRETTTTGRGRPSAAP